MIDTRLLGKWESVSDSQWEPVTIEFTNDGLLSYTIHAEYTDQTILLHDRIEGGVIRRALTSARTDPPPATPCAARTPTRPPGGPTRSRRRP